MTVDPESLTANVGGNHSLTCSASVVLGLQNTPQVEWVGRTGTKMDTRTTYRLNSICEADAGNYVCRATLESPALTNPLIVERTVPVIVRRKYCMHLPDECTIIIVNLFLYVAPLQLTINVDYTSPPDFVGGSNDYRAASTLLLTCQVTGGSGTISYLWISTCTGCFVLRKTDQTISRITLRSSESGTHTCTATDSVGNSGSASIMANIIGRF